MTFNIIERKGNEITYEKCITEQKKILKLEKIPYEKYNDFNKFIGIIYRYFISYHIVSNNNTEREVIYKKEIQCKNVRFNDFHKLVVAFRDQEDDMVRLKVQKQTIKGQEVEYHSWEKVGE